MSPATALRAASRASALVTLLAVATAASPTGAADVAKGEALYRAACQPCHGEEGRGDGPASAQMPLNPRDFGTGQFKFDTNADGSWTDADLENVIRNGAAAYGGSPLMPAWSNLSEADLHNLVAFIRTLQR